VLTVQVAFVREIPHNKQWSPNLKGSSYAMVEEAADYAFHGSPTVRVSEEHRDTSSFNSDACSEKVYPESNNARIDTARVAFAGFFADVVV